METMEDKMTKTFGKSNLTRQVLEDMPNPVNTDSITDEQMEELAEYVEGEISRKYPSISEKFFEFRRIGVRGYKSRADYNFLYTIDADRASVLFWELLEWYAIERLGAKYRKDK
jgi:hypothetical protein